MPSRLIFDCEANGFLFDATEIHCICCKDINTNEIYHFKPDSIERGLNLISSYDIICGHNICGYDIPLFKKLYPGFTYKVVRDSLCMSKLFNPELKTPGLEYYGKKFGRYKPEHSNWLEYSSEMLHRCMEDVEINHLTYNYLVDKYCTNWKWLDALELEQQFVLYSAIQELEGVDVDVDHARKTIKRLDDEIALLDKQLYDIIPKKVLMVGKEEGYKPFKKDGSLSEATKKWFSI